MKLERRFTHAAACPVRLEERADGKSAKISGYGAVFYDGNAGTEYQLWDNYFERIMPGAFDRAMREKDDVRGLFNHDPNQILGRSSAGTMTLTVDGRGLQYHIDAGDTTVARDVTQHLKRKDVTGSSFSFTPTEEHWIKQGEGKDKRFIREIVSVRLYDVGPVTFPAYEATTSAARAAGDVDEARRSLAAFEAKESGAAAEVVARANARARTLRLAELGVDLR